MTTDEAPTGHHIPSVVQTLNPLVRRLLRIGMPMGPNALLTVRGRTSGAPRTFPITILETGGRRYVFAAFGETNWVRNLRAAGVATLRRGRRDEAVVAVELPIEAAAPILQAGLAAALKIKVFGPMVGGWYGITPDSSPADYLNSARSHAGFELRAAR
jgi:deazaflavin-dependent oxidoreductase (nitroreductase family)